MKEKLNFIKMALSIGVILALACSWLMSQWAIQLDGYEAPQMVKFLGRFHPMVLHMPIGFMALALLLDTFHLIPKKVKKRFPIEDKAFPSSKWLMGLVVVSTLVTVIHGILLFASGGYEGSALAERHMIGGMIFLTAVSIGFLMKLWFDHVKKMNWVSSITTVSAMIIMSISAHDGASLTHGENYLSQHAPEFLKPILEPGYEVPEVKKTSLKVPVGERNIYQVAIQPIFDQSCVQCHKESKQKGKLRMDSYEQLVKGGVGGPAFVPGDVEKSYFIERINLPLDDDEHMPPEGKTPLSPEQIRTLEWWVSIGAPNEGSLVSYNPNEEVYEAVKQFHDIDDSEVNIDSVKSESKRSTVTVFKDYSDEIMTFNQTQFGSLKQFQFGEKGLSYTSFNSPENVNDETLQELKPYSEALEDINLNRTSVTTSGLKGILQGSPHLQRISLNECEIGDDIVNTLMLLDKLEFLSVFGTDLTNSALMELIEHPNLNVIYCGNTQIDQSGVDQAKELTQKIQIVF